MPIVTGKGRNTDGLAGWLASLSNGELTELLRARPDVLLAPEPPSFTELADRLGTPYSVREAMATLSEAGVRLVEAICAVGAKASTRQVHELLGGPDVLPAQRLTDELAGLRRLALVWPTGARLAMPGSLRAMLPNPLSLGRPASELLGALTVEQLQRIGARYGLQGLPRKAAWVAEIGAAISEPDTVRRLLAAAAPEVRELVEQVAWHGPQVGGVFLPSQHQRVPPGHRGVEVALYGWVVPAQWGSVGEMPREVALAVRGRDHHPTLPPQPPLPTGQRLDPDQLLATSRSAAGASVDGVSRLLALLGRTPLSTVQTGGVGVRELRRAAKELRAREHEVRLWLETAAAAGLVTVQDGELLPTVDVDAWTGVEPASALATLLVAWWELAVTPTHRVDEAGKQQPAVGGRAVEVGATRLRADLLGTLAGLGESTPPSDFDAVIDQLAWRRPLAYGNAELLGPFAVATRAEARAFGLIADDALTPLGAALLDSAGAAGPAAALDSAGAADRATGRASARAGGPAAALAEKIADLLPRPTRTATFLPDLTAIVAGSAAVELAALLDGCADAESRDVASTWRFGPASVRRALDAGQTADRLLGELAAVADKPLPQPLTYLVNDVARRHGQLRVRPVTACVCVPDPALAAEVARHRSLAALSLVALADTVLASSKSVPETLAALRAAGYAPVGHDATGAPVLERAAARRAKPTRRGQRRPLSSAPPPPPGVSPEELAARLVACPSNDPPIRSVGGAGGRAAAAIRAAARQLSAGEVELLASAIEDCLPVHIDYLSASGGLTSRVVHPLDLEQHRLVAWCELHDDERNFVLGRIAAVSPAES